MDNFFTEEQVNELKELIKKYLLPDDIEFKCIASQSSNVAYIFPVEADKPVKIVYEGEPLLEDEAIELLYKKLKEQSNES